MGKQHITRLAVPKSWDVPTKTTRFTTRPLPGAHPIKMGVPLNIVIRDMLGLAKTAKEVKTLLHNKEILVDGKERREPKMIVGLMDVVSVPKTKSHYRLIVNNKGKIIAVEIKEDEAKFKLAKIIGKSKIRGGKMQINLSDGRNVIVDKDVYNTNSSIVINIPENKIKEEIKLEKGVIILLIGGKHMGEVGVIEELDENKVVYKEDNRSQLTLKKYAFVIGKDKSLITLAK